MAFPCPCSNPGSGGGFNGGPNTPVCPPADASKTIPDQSHINSATPPIVPIPVTLSGGDFFVTGPASLTISFVVSRTSLCPATYQVTVDGAPVGLAFPIAAGTNTVSGFATVDVGAIGSPHDIGLSVTIPAGECIEHITSGGMAVHAECVGSFTPVFIGA